VTARLFAKTICVGMASVLIGGCASTGQNSGGMSSDEAKCVALTVGGAVLGALIGGRNSRGSGAAVGGLVGLAACMIVKATTVKEKSAELVNREYASDNGGSLPQQTIVKVYDVNVVPSPVAQIGKEITVSSRVEVVSGARDPVSKIEEHLVLLDPEGKEFKRKPNVISDTGGRYSNTFIFKLPEGAPQGQYTVRTVLFVNQKQVGGKQGNLQMAFQVQPLTVVAMMHSPER
jgi:hypothetical protein